MAMMVIPFSNKNALLFFKRIGPPRPRPKAEHGRRADPSLRGERPEKTIITGISESAILKMLRQRIEVPRRRLDARTFLTEVLHGERDAPFLDINFQHPDVHLFMQ